MTDRILSTLLNNWRKYHAQWLCKCSMSMLMRIKLGWARQNRIELGWTRWPNAIDILSISTLHEASHKVPSRNSQTQNLKIWSSPNQLAPHHMENLFERNSKFTSCSLRNTETDLRIPKRISTNRQKCFSFRGAKLWNGLSADLKRLPSRDCFKVLKPNEHIKTNMSFYYSEFRSYALVRQTIPIFIIALYSSISSTIIRIGTLYSS